jgi:hypothetical protein
MLFGWLRVYYRIINEGVVDHTSDSKHNVVVDKANNYPFAGKHKCCILDLGNILHVKKGLTNPLLRYAQLQYVIPKGTLILR